MPEAIQKIADKNINLFHLIVLVASLLLGAAKVYHDLASEKEQRINNTKMIEELKKKSEENNKTTTELKTQIAVQSTQLEAIRRQNTTVLIKLEKLYEILINKSREHK